ncbi:Com family DNA-binding transcriptional regulator [Methylomonas fluvii]|uniref:Com family DNA-binding transcriptional regulator n=1 Tax=Methylomonas fluvii TaxID=1854564 RepID=A0ABR9DIF9_9GAMM|nr:Com family DNA-binding transcriptional regulator [Methylomonas fluvii]
MEIVRCGQCGRKLAEAEYSRLAIKCPRCGTMNELKACEPLTSAPRAPDQEVYDGKTNCPLGGRQTSPS